MSHKQLINQFMDRQKRPQSNKHGVLLCLKSCCFKDTIVCVSIWCNTHCTETSSTYTVFRIYFPSTQQTCVCLLLCKGKMLHSYRAIVVYYWRTLCCTTHILYSEKLSVKKILRNANFSISHIHYNSEIFSEASIIVVNLAEKILQIADKLLIFCQHQMCFAVMITEKGPGMFDNMRLILASINIWECITAHLISVLFEALLISCHTEWSWQASSSRFRSDVLRSLPG